MTAKISGTSPDRGQIEVPPEHLVAAQAALSVEQRISLARKEGTRAPDGKLSDAEQRMRRHILYIIAHDAEVRVREALAATLAENPAALHEVVMALANDEDLVASPVLRLSTVISPADLVALVEGQISAAKMNAVAERAEVPPAVSLALIEHGDATTATHLLRNRGADISEPAFHRIVDRHGTHEPVQAGMVDRSALPATVIDRVVELVAADLLTRLVDRHKLSNATASKVILDTRERATLGLASGLSPDGMQKLVWQLHDDKRLTPSVLLRGLCLGNLDFIAHVISVETRRGVGDVNNRLTSDSPESLHELWRNANLPEELWPVVKAAIEVLRETHQDSEKWDVAYYRGRIIERLISRLDDLGVAFSDEDISYLVAESTRGSTVIKDFA